MAFCVSLSTRTHSLCMELIESLQSWNERREKECSQQPEVMVEVRIDLIAQAGKGEISREELKTIYSANGLKKIATVRDLQVEGFTEERFEYLKEAIEYGVDFIDIEFEAPDEYRTRLIQLAKERRVKVIISYHNYEITPEAARLKAIMNTCYEYKADVAKLATFAKSCKDSARVLSLYDNERPVVAIAMGKFGEITRVAALKLGAPFTFVAQSAEGGTAPGQLTLKQMHDIMSNMSAP